MESKRTRHRSGSVQMDGVALRGELEKRNGVKKVAKDIRRLGETEESLVRFLNRMLSEEFVGGDKALEILSRMDVGKEALASLIKDRGDNRQHPSTPEAHRAGSRTAARAGYDSGKLVASSSVVAHLDRSPGALVAEALAATVRLEGGQRPASKAAEVAVMEVERRMHRLLPDLADFAGVERAGLGLHAWVNIEAGTISTGRIALARIARVRHDLVSPSPARVFSYGEGVVGRCWQMQTEFAINLRSAKYVRFLSGSECQTQDLLGQSIDDFRNSVQYFRLIGAVPIVVETECVGVLSLNYERDSKGRSSALWSADVRNAMRKAAHDIAVTLRVACVQQWRNADASVP